MKTYHVYGLGAALVDTEIEITDHELTAMGVEKGMMTLVDETRQHELLRHLEGHMVYAKRASGGSACNSVIAASYFGAKTFYSCKVANDDNGHFYLQDLQKAGVDSNFHSEKETGITGKCLVLISPDAERSMNTFLGISESLSVHDLNETAIKDSHYLYIEGYQATSTTGRKAAIAAKQVAEKHATKTAISLSDPSMVVYFKASLQAMIGDGVDLLFCNETEALGWADTDSLDVAKTALKAISQTFVITLGAKGSLVFDGKREIVIAGHSVHAVDTTGAGDMFAGAFLYAITHGHDYEQAGQLASRAAAEVVSIFGPRLPPKQYRSIQRNGLHNFYDNA